MGNKRYHDIVSANALITWYVLAFIVNQRNRKKEKISKLRKADDNIQFLELAKSRNEKQIENKTKI